MTLAYRDSSIARPNAAQAAAAYAAGVRAWGGYLAAVVPPGPRSQGGSNLATSWTQADFDVLRAAGIAPLAFCSGWDDAAACGALARAWRVRLMLDVEDGIRGDGPWVDPWLAASGAGLYGLCPVHVHPAPAHITARYPGGDPGLAWDPQCAAPAGLLGWQSQGTHIDAATGLEVDSGWVDDGFGLAIPAPIIIEDDMTGIRIGTNFGGQDHVFETDDSGRLLHWWDGGHGLTDPPEVRATSLVPGGELAAWKTDTQLHIVGRLATGGRVHLWTPAGVDPWGQELLG